MDDEKRVEMDELRKVGKTKLQNEFAKLLKKLTKNDFQVELELVYPHGILTRVSFLIRKRELTEKETVESN